METLTLEAQSDISLNLYDPQIPINNFSMGNKIFEAMMLGLPVITNVAHDMVNETGNGIIVNYSNIEQIRDAVIKLKDNRELRKKLACNSRNAYVQKYNWAIMEVRLFEVYNKLLK